jgi:hypothetical protein
MIVAMFLAEAWTLTKKPPVLGWAMGKTAVELARPLLSTLRGL